MLSARIDEEYRVALDAFVEELRGDPKFAKIQKYDVLELMLKDLLSEAGRAKVKAELAKVRP